jgi:hypothetical protein
MFVLSDRQTGEVTFEGQRVTERLPCFVCRDIHAKQSWCLIDPIRGLSICPRVESSRRIGDAGWLHARERDIGTIVPRGRVFVVRRETEERRDFGGAFLMMQGDARGADVARLALHLSIPVSAVEGVPLGVKRRAERVAYAFAMLDPDDRHWSQWAVIGIKLRTDDAKFCEKGSRLGLIVPSNFDHAAPMLVVTEGESDLMVAASWGLNAVARAGCEQSVVQIGRLARGKRLVIVSDKDEAGRRGAARLRDYCSTRARSVTVLEPPCKDIRAWHASGANADDFRWRLRSLNA